MASVINTNVASLNAQKNLTQSQNALATSLQRLSSGLRINSAKDDAAGLAISDRFTTQIRGLNQAGRNANDAISLSQTAEGALGEVTSNLQRIRELAVQSANATNSASDRGALDLEVQQRLAEIDRISSATSFNGQKILDGSFGNAAFQIGANVGQTINLDLSTSMRNDSLGSAATVATSDISDVFGGKTGLQIDAGDLQLSIDGGTTNINVGSGTYATSADLAAAINIAYQSASSTTDSIATVGGSNELVITNSSLSNTIAFTGDDASTVGLTTVGVATESTVDNNLTADSFKFTTGTTSGDALTVDGTEIASPATALTATELAAEINAAYNTANSLSGAVIAAVNSTGDGITITNSTGTAVAFGGTDQASLGVAASVLNATVDNGITNTDFEFTTGTTSGDALTVDGTEIASPATGLTSTALAAEINAAYNTANSTTGVVIAAVNTTSGGITITNNDNANAIVFAGTDATTLGINAGVAAATLTDTVANGSDLTSAFLVENVATSFSLDGASDELTVQLGSSATVSINGSFANGTELAVAIQSQVEGIGASFDTTTNLLTLSGGDTVTIGGDTAKLASLGLTAAAATPTVVSGNLTSADVTTVASANDMIFRIDSALNTVSDIRSTFGAIQNRFESTINNLSTSVESLSSARSRILDADFAQETANLTRAQILQQAGTAMLSQANALPQNVLSLLG